MRECRPLETGSAKSSMAWHIKNGDIVFSIDWAKPCIRGMRKPSDPPPTREDVDWAIAHMQERRKARKEEEPEREKEQTEKEEMKEEREQD